MRLPVAGGLPQALCNVSRARPLAWSERGYLLTTDTKTMRLLLIPDTGGEGRLLGELDPGRHETAHVRPQFLPGGARFLYFAVSSNPEESAVYTDSIDSASVSGKQSRERVLTSPSAVVFAPLPGAMDASESYSCSD